MLHLRLIGEARQRIRELRKQRTADIAGTDQTHRQRGRRQPERAVRGAQTAYRIGIGDGHRDVAFTGALRDRADVHARTGQAVEQPRGHAGHADHAIADHREHGDAAGRIDTFHLAVGDGLGERGAHRIAAAVCLRRGHEAADRMFAGALRNHRHRDAGLAQRGEHALRSAGHADQSGAAEFQQRHVAHQAQAFHRRTGGRRQVVFGDARARRGQIARVADHDRQLGLHRRRHRLRMQHFRTEISEFAGLRIRHRRQTHRVGHQARIGAQHAVDVGPDGQVFRVEQHREDGAGIIAAVAAQRGAASLAVARDKAGHHHVALGMLRAPCGEMFAGARPVDGDAQLARMRYQHLPRIQSRPARIFAAQRSLQQTRRPHFAQALYRCEVVLTEVMIGQAMGIGDAAELRRQRDAFGIEPCAELMRALRIQPTRFGKMTVAQSRPCVLPVVAAAGGVRKRGQGVGDALHRRYHDHARRRRVLQQRGDVAIAVGIGHAAAAEFVRAISAANVLVHGLAVSGAGRSRVVVKRIHVELLVGALCRRALREASPATLSGRGAEGEESVHLAVAARTTSGCNASGHHHRRCPRFHTAGACRGADG